MKSITILAAALLLSSCKSLPPYPEELKVFHQVVIRGMPLSAITLESTVNADVMTMIVADSRQEYNCLEFHVVDINPYKFDFIGLVPFHECHEVAGYKAQENVVLWNWIDDVFRNFSKGKHEP